MKCLLFSLNLHKCFIYCNRQHFVHRQIIPLARNHKKIETKIMLNESGENKRLGAQSLMRHLCQPPQHQQNAHTAKSQKRSPTRRLKELKKQKMRRSTVRCSLLDAAQSITLVNSQELQVSTQDLEETQPTQTLTWEGTLQAHPLLWSSQQQN